MKKKILCLLLIITFIISEFNIATASDYTSTIQYFDNGDYIITETCFSTSNARTSMPYVRRATYYTSDNTAIFTVVLSATFNYSYGQYASAVNSDISVNLTNSSAIFKSKTSSVTGNTAKGSATVFYHGSDRTMYVSMSCDIYGNVH